MHTFESLNGAASPISPSQASQRTPNVLTCAAAAQMLQVKPVTVRRLVQRGLIRRIPGIRHLRISESEMQKFIASSPNSKSSPP